MECKVIYHNAKFSHELVLIETLWNVKYDIGDLWSQDGGGINRNIVECKGKTDKANFFDQNMY